MKHVVGAVVGEPWAITHDGLHQIQLILARHTGVPDAQGEPEWNRPDYQMAAGPSAQRLAGAQRAFVDKGVAIIQVMGPIFPRANMMTDMSGATSLAMLSHDLRVAANDEGVDAILLQMDTPGGAVTGTADFAEKVAAVGKTKKTVAHVSGLGASAGYWIASQAGEIVLDRTGMVGSIGVVSAVPVQVAPDRAGQMWFDVVSSNAPNKRPDVLTEDGLKEVKSTLDAIEQLFVADVARGRGVSVDTVRTDFGRGGLKIGSEAVKAGMANRVASYEATLSALQRDAAAARRVRQLRRHS